MSRRKQAKPRALKREEWEEGEEEEEEDTEEMEATEDGGEGGEAPVCSKDNCTNGTIETGEAGARTRPGREKEGDSEHSSSSGPSKDTRRRGGRRAHHSLSSFTPTPIPDHTPSSTSQNSLAPTTLPLSQLPDLRKLRERSDDEESVGSLDSEVSVGGSSWDVGSDGRGSLSPASSATPTSASETDVEAAATVGVTQTTPYQCSFCDRAFPRLSYLKRHEQTHADQLPFRCEFCGRLFKHKRSRDRHVKLHTGDKKYKCCHCEAAFSRSDHLKIHKKTHDTQKPYQCSVCNRGYNTAAALTAHMQNHKAKLTAHALNQLLKDAQAPVETHALTQLLRDSAAAESHAQSLNHFLKDSQKEHLLSPKGIEIGAGSSPGDLTSSPAGEPSPSLSPVAAVRCPVCHTHCKSQAHLQRHVSRYHGEEQHGVPLERPASRGGGSGTSSVGGASSAASTPSPRPPSSLPSPRPLSNPLLSLVAGKLACLYCSRDGFPSLEALQLHLQSSHGSVMNGEVRDMTTMLGLHPSLGASLSASGMATSLASPLGPGSSRGVSCELCGARVGGVTALQRHVVTAHTFTDLLARAAEGVFCAQCLLPFSNPGALAEHIKLVHASPVLSAVLNKRPPSPPTDTPTDLSKKSRHDGLTSDLPASTLLCSQCNAPFTNFEAFRRHLKSHLDGGEQVSATGGSGVQLACPECRLPLTSEAALEGHVATHLGVTSTEYGCQACLKLFSKPDELQKHLMDIHAHHLYRCALCKEMFDSKVSIQVHFAVKHSNECKVHKCTRCSLIFRSQSEFEGHIRVTHIRRGQMGGDSVGGGSVGGGGGSYRCLLCPLSLSSEAELAAHVSTHQRQFQCSLCDDAFHVEFLLDKHMQTQHNSELNGNVPQPENLAKPRRSPQKKDLRCDICDAEFSTDSALMTHRKQAHNIKSGSVGVTAKVAAASLSLFCAYCSEACKSRGDLEAHMKSHQGNGGRHKCNICDELCPSAALLAQHKLTHVKVVSGSACAVCREPLTSEQQFSSHQNEHHPSPLPQPCVVCRQTLVTDMEVSVHARFHATQAAQAAAAASVASVLSSGELHPQSTNSLVITTASNAPTTTTSSTNGSSNSSSSSNSTSPRLSPSQRCQECHIKFETAEEAEAHAAVHHQQQQQQGFGRSMASSSRTYQCIKCQESFASEAEIEAHVASHLLHEGSVHECHLCRATFDTPLRLQCHLIEHTFEGCGSFTCYMCSSVFTTASRLQQHMVEHGLSARPYDCHHCHQRFFFRAELENHALSHPEAAKGGCRECLASFPDLPRRSARRPSLSCGTSNPSVLSHVAQNPGKSDLRPTRPSSPVRDETDIGPTNGHASSMADSVED
ncbi:zinc finger protein 423-like isoform X2 [Portunus trituberculatus]|uniref:zinc finger protein 423-like isoform X2 n=1 Tax=Portunus trituberculatus TaxID=210409 RepID=UPI001E1D1497|nr:zinc finger protein 423-like isoform X2 [Portunus trituberculatus]